MGIAARDTPGSRRSAFGPVIVPPSSSSSSSERSTREGGLVRFAARVEYDGTGFAGFQVQPGRRTVQGELEAALRSISGGERIRIDGAGRTDAGVHASGQLIAFSWSGRRIAAKVLGRAIRAVLPPDVTIGSLRRVDIGFVPRRAAVRREY